MDQTAHRAADLPDPSQQERGQGMVEYAFILMLVALIVLISLQVLGTQTGNLYSNISNALPGH